MNKLPDREKEIVATIAEAYRILANHGIKRRNLRSQRQRILSFV